jgi:hypothetical protein
MSAIVRIDASSLPIDTATQLAKRCVQGRDGKMELHRGEQGAYYIVIENMLTATTFVQQLGLMNGVKFAPVDSLPQRSAAAGANPLMAHLQQDPEVQQAVSAYVVNLFTPKTSPFGDFGANPFS